MKRFVHNAHKTSKAMCDKQTEWNMPVGPLILKCLRATKKRCTRLMVANVLGIMIRNSTDDI